MMAMQAEKPQSSGDNNLVIPPSFIQHRRVDLTPDGRRLVYYMCKKCCSLVHEDGLDLHVTSTCSANSGSEPKGLKKTPVAPPESERIKYEAFVCLKCSKCFSEESGVEPQSHWNLCKHQDFPLSPSQEENDPAKNIPDYSFWKFKS